MSLAFLSPAGPAAESPFATVAAAAGATFEERDGWRIAVRFAEPEVEAAALRETAVWADVSHLRKLELTGQANPELGTATRAGRGWVCPVTPGRSLLLGAESDDASALDVTTQLAALRVAGPLARELLARFCALDLRPGVTPPGAFRPGSVARTPGFVLCEAADVYLMLVGAAYAAYVWEVVADAGSRLGARPAGADAVPSGVAAHA